MATLLALFLTSSLAFDQCDFDDPSCWYRVVFMIPQLDYMGADIAEPRTETMREEIDGLMAAVNFLVSLERRLHPGCLRHDRDAHGSGDWIQKPSDW